MKRIGRPAKYTKLLMALNDHDLYSPASITYFALKHGLLLETDAKAQKLELRRIRISLGRRSNIYSFPDEGDGTITLPGQPPIPAWFGWRWKETLK